MRLYLVSYETYYPGLAVVSASSPTEAEELVRKRLSGFTCLEGPMAVKELKPTTTPIIHDLIAIDP